jgi:hypothetical protein
VKGCCVDRLSPPTLTGHSEIGFAAMQQAAPVANREIKQATESFINNGDNRWHRIAVVGRTVEHEKLG